MSNWPTPRRLLIELDDGTLYALLDDPEVVAANKRGGPYQVVMPGRAVEALDSRRPHLMMQVDDRAPVGRISPTVTMSAPCPHPERGGRHEVYVRPGGGAYCRACGAV